MRNALNNYLLEDLLTLLPVIIEIYREAANGDSNAYYYYFS